MQAGATSGTSAPTAIDTASVASLDAETDPTAADASSSASSDSPSRPHADTLLARSTADFAAQLAQARGMTAASPAQPTDAASQSTGSAAPTTLHRSDVSTSIGDALFPGRFAAEVALLGALDACAAEQRDLGGEATRKERVADRRRQLASMQQGRMCSGRRRACGFGRLRCVRRRYAARLRELSGEISGRACGERIGARPGGRIARGDVRYVGGRGLALRIERCSR